MPIKSEEDLIRLLDLHKHRAMEKLKKSNAFEYPKQYEAAWENFVKGELIAKHFPKNISQSMPLLDRLAEIEELHKQKWISQLQHFHNEEYWGNYIQNKKNQIQKDDLPPK